MVRSALNFISAILLIGMFLLAGCSTELNTKELQDKVIQANSNIRTYSLDLKMNTNSIIIGDESLGQRMEIKSESNTNGAVDRTNKKMALKGKVDASGILIEVDSYIVNDYLYTKSLDMWVKTKLDQDTWAQQDQISRLVELARSGDIERLEDEGTYYVIKINPDLKKVAELALKQQQQSELLTQNMDLGNAIKSYSAIYWINKETFVIEKSKIDLKMVVDIGNQDQTNANQGKMELDSSIELKISNINQDVIITLPEEANDAIDFVELNGFQ